MQELQKIAVVIDADNTQISKLEDVFHEISTRKACLWQLA